MDLEYIQKANELVGAVQEQHLVIEETILATKKALAEYQASLLDEIKRLRNFDSEAPF